MSEGNCSNTLSAVYYPENVDGILFRKHVSDYGVIIAGGLLNDIKGDYFRVGHMGPVTKTDLVAVLSAIEYGLSKTPYEFPRGKSIAVFHEFV